MSCKIPVLLSALALSLAACATADIVPMGADTYMISQTSAGGVFKSMSSLKAGVMTRANEFAEAKGKVAIPVAAKETPSVPGRMPNFEYQFMLVDRYDPRASGTGLVKTPDVVIENRGHQGPAMVINNQSGADAKTPDVYTELLKLDELRKKRILTEEEFEVQKQKLLQGK